MTQFTPTIYPTTAIPTGQGGAASAPGFNRADRAHPLLGYSIGGWRGPLPLTLQRVHPMIYSLDHRGVQTWADFLFAHIFRDLSAGETAGAGLTDYVALVMKNTMTAVTNLEVWFDQPISGVGTVSIWKDDFSDGWVERVASPTTAPTGAVWSTPTSGGKLNLGSLAADGEMAFWLKRVIGAASGARAHDWLRLNWQTTEYTEAGLTIPYNRRGTADLTIAITGERDGEGPILTPYGEVFTITVKDSTGTLVDPASNLVLVSLTGSQKDPWIYTLEAQYQGPQASIGRADKTATGTYRFEWKPSQPGHYFGAIEVGGGEGYQEFNVEVSPV